MVRLNTYYRGERIGVGGQGGPRLQEASFSVPGYPLIPAFSPKGEKESDTQL